MDSKRTRQGSTFLTAMEARGVQRKSPEEGGKACVHSVNSFSYCCCFYLLFCLGMYKQNLEDLPPPAPGREEAKGNKNKEKKWSTVNNKWKKGKSYRIENTERGNWRRACSRETLTSTRHFLKVNRGAGGCCPAMLCLEMWEDDGMNGHQSHSHQDPPTKLPSSGDMNNRQGQGLEEVDEDVLQLGRALVREYINKKLRGKSSARTSMRISGGEAAACLIWCTLKVPDVHQGLLPLQEKKRIPSLTP